MKKPTIKDVASLACVSTALVSRVMNAPLRADGTPDCIVHRDTARRIFDAVAELGYRPNKAAVSLRKVLKKRIGVIIPDIANPFFADIARSIESIARREGYIVLFGSTDEDAGQLATLTEAFMEDGVDGIIITPGVDSAEPIARTVKQGMPVVLTIRDIPELQGVGRVLTDDDAATELAIGHLTDQGFGPIEMISPRRRISNARHREELFAAKMKELGFEGRIHHCGQTEDREDVKLILEDALRRGVRAIYCASASIPLMVLQASRDMGIRIPEDIAVMGYDGGALYRMLSPSISQIEFSREDIAREAFLQLTKMIARHDIGPEARYLEPHLVTGDSTADIPSHDSMPENITSRHLLSALRRASAAIDDAVKHLE